MAIYSRGWRTFFKILYRGRQPMIELASLIAVLILIFGVSAYLAERFMETFFNYITFSSHSRLLELREIKTCPLKIIFLKKENKSNKIKIGKIIRKT